jgi:flagellar motor switch/type III secretory pathway protein FliN
MASAVTAEPLRSVQPIPSAPSQHVAALSAGVRSVLETETADASPASAASQQEAAETADGEQSDTESALISSSEALDALEDTGLIERKSVEARLPVQLNVGIPIRDFRVRNLVALVPGALIESQWAPGEDVPVASSDVQLAWSEFEVVDTQLAVRLTRLT